MYYVECNFINDGTKFRKNCERSSEDQEKVLSKQSWNVNKRKVKIRGAKGKEISGTETINYCNG